MAQLTFSMPKSLTDKLDKIGNTAGYASKMLKAEQDITYPEVIRRLEQHRESGELISSIKKTTPKMDKNGVWRAQIRPSGKDYKGVSNNEKMLSLEYGTSKQVATPVFRPAKEATESAAQEGAQRIFNEAVKL